MGFFAEPTAIVIEIIIANRMTTKRIGLSEIRLNDRGSRDWMVGAAIVGEAKSVGLGSIVGVGDVLTGELVGVGSGVGIISMFETNCLVSSIG